MREEKSKESLLGSKDSSMQDEETSLLRRDKIRCCQISPQVLVCISHAFSAWGYRMWEFAIGLYLIGLTPGSLRLTAIYQLVSTLSIVIFGPLVGDWIDANPRLKVVQVSLVIQNVAAIICGVLLLIMLELIQHIPHPVVTLLEAIIIIVASVTDVSTVCTQIALEKDWVVVIAGSDKDLLARTNSILKRIDLCCKILAPILVGQIMTYISKVAGIVFLVGWNVVSVFVEYFLLWKVYHSVLELSQKVLDSRQRDESEDSSSVDLAQEESQGSTESLELIENNEPGKGQNGTEEGLFKRFKKRIITFKNAWLIYFRQSVARPGLALASLYFTVISFSSITAGYLYTQCLSESIQSIARGAGSVFGLSATFVFPVLRNAVGIVRCGLFSMLLQFSCLLLCAAAVFAPGSPFFLLPPSLRYDANQCSAPVSSSSLPQYGASDLATPMLTPTFQRLAMTKELINTSMSSVLPTATSNTFPTEARILHNNSSLATPSQNYSNTSEAPTFSKQFSYVSTGLLLAGMISSRLGLWMSDLTITQLFQEAVPEQERGIVGGMQNSFNSVLSLLIYFLVIALPKPEHFGILTLMSVSAVGIGGLLYASFAYKVRGHLFHLEKVRTLCS